MGTSNHGSCPRDLNHGPMRPGSPKPPAPLGRGPPPQPLPPGPEPPAPIALNSTPLPRSRRHSPPSPAPPALVRGVPPRPPLLLARASLASPPLALGPGRPAPTAPGPWTPPHPHPETGSRLGRARPGNDQAEMELSQAPFSSLWPSAFGPWPISLSGQIPKLSRVAYAHLYA